jgi:hypothetical protein
VMSVLGSNGMRGFTFEGCAGDVGYDLRVHEAMKHPRNSKIPNPDRPPSERLPVCELGWQWNECDCWARDRRVLVHNTWNTVKSIFMRP